jgi:Rrf2 family protein
MRFSASARQAVHGLVHLAEREAGEFFVADAVAKACGLPAPYMRRLLGALAVAGVVRSCKGPNGGFELARPPATITLLEILEAVGGRIAGDVEPWGAKDAALDRRLEAVLEAAAQGVRRHFSRVRLSELMDRAPSRGARRKRP